MKCKYKNCSKELPEYKRSDSKFCNRKCKTNNRKVNKYHSDKLKWVRVIDLSPEQIEVVKSLRNG